MSTLILNGSPNAQGGNTQVFIERFMKGADQSYEVRYVAGEEAQELAEYLHSFDTVLVFLPMYVFSVPGIVMKLFERMRRAKENASIGFVGQYGFAEGSQAEYLRRQMAVLSVRLGYRYLGTVTRGNAAGVNMMPESMNRKLFEQIEALGARYAEDGTFDEAVIARLSEPESLKPWQARTSDFMNRIGVNKIFWHQMMKSKGGYERRLDRPYTS